LWITEFGFTNCTLQSNVCVTEQQQAAYLAETFTMAARWSYVPVVISYLVRDQGVEGDWTSTFGEVGVDGTLKQAFTSVADAWTCIAAGTC